MQSVGENASARPPLSTNGQSVQLTYEIAGIGAKVKIVEPGVIKTDFASRGLEFNNDESITEYQDVVQKLMAAIGPPFEGGSEPQVVAEVIYQAATDGTNQLRYTAGPDAKEIIANRKAADDETFLARIKAQFGLWWQRSKDALASSTDAKDMRIAYSRVRGLRCLSP